ncbi:helix-turn-helix domain-containing protein [Echinicola sediminis]
MITQSYKYGMKSNSYEKGNLNYRFILVVSGISHFRIGNTSIDIKSPCTVILTPEWQVNIDFSAVYESYQLCFHETELINYPHTLRNLLSHNTPVFLIDTDSINYLLSQFLLLTKVPMSQKNDVYEACINLLLQKYLTLKKEKYNFEDHEIRQLLTFKTLINQHFRNLKHLEPYSEILNLSVSQLNKIAQRVSGLQAKQFINNRLIIEAKLLLVHTENTINEITDHLQFTDPSNFIKFFKSKTGFTPRKYRIKMKNGDSFS